ncbi:MAG: C39 family peptidase [Cyclobacteriaceae bacterium]
MNKNSAQEVKTLSLDIHAQPNDETCGPTCLQSVYRYYNDHIDLADVISEVKTLSTGGTLAVMLGNHALSRGYKVTIYTYNLQMFDPTWFTPGVDLKAKIEEQLLMKQSNRIAVASGAYLKFLDLGGKIKYEELSPKLIRKILHQNHPILTGLSATYLYNCSREIGELNEYHDVLGEPTGHFVVVHGYDALERVAQIADPLSSNPLSDTHYYRVPLQRLINSILLGIVTYDANLLVISK